MGARQVGKTWLMKAFAEERYPNDTVFVDFRDDETLCNAIEDGKVDALGILDLISTATASSISTRRSLNLP